LAAVSLLLRARFRLRWRSWLSLCLLIALASGLVLAGVAAGRRTATAFPRFEAAHGYDAFVLSAAPIPKIAALPGVALVTPLLVTGGGTPACACSRPINHNYFTVVEAAPKDLPRLAKLVAGRMPDQSDPHQVLASFTLAQDAGVHLGTVIRVPLYSPSQRSAVQTGAGIRPGGPVFAVRVVGIEAAEIEFPATNIPAYDLYTTRAFARIVNPGTVALPAYFVRLRRGAAGLPRFQGPARALGALAVDDLDTQATAIDSSIHPQAVGWWILAGLATLAGIVVLAQALARQGAIEARPNATLSALGATRRQLVALAMTTTLIIAAGGVVAGVALAYLLSPLTPVGEARLADPSPGFTFDALVLLPGALAAVVVVLALGLWPAIRAARTRRPADTALARPSRIVALLADAGAPPSALIGVRHAFERGRDRFAAPTAPALLGSVLAVTALCATVVFGASLTHLTATPALYGQPFELWFAPKGPASPAQLGQLLTSLERDRAISGITAVAEEDVSINGQTVESLAGQSLRGQLLFTTAGGRLPDTAGQVALGTTTLRQLGAHIGSLVRVTTPGPGGQSRTSSYKVAGTAVFAPDFDAAGLGTGAVFTLPGLLGSQCAPVPAQRACQLRAVGAGGSFLVRAVSGPQGLVALTRLARAYPSQVNFPATPANLVNFGQAVNFPLIFGLLLSLFAAATLVHLLAVSVARRRREAGLLKALGFVGRQVAFAVSWQTTTIALAGIVIGVPAGIATGRILWRSLASNLGALPVPVVTVPAIAVVASGTVLIANVLAIGPALAASRSRPASLLRAE
jgi:ABC-type lipoprotein release transport system permease subunit